MTASGHALPPVQDLYEQAPCGLLVCDADGLIRSANATLLGWLCLAETELIGKTKITDLLTMGGKIFFQTHLLPLLRMQGSVAEVKLDTRGREGFQPMVWNIRRIAGQGPEIWTMSIFQARDRHRYEQELMLARQRAESALGELNTAHVQLASALKELKTQREQAMDRAQFAEQMVGIVSHDLRNPLAAIDMSARLLQRMGLDADQLKVLQRILNSAQRSHRLIEDLLDFSQLRMGRRLRMSPRPVALEKLVGDALEELRLAHPAATLVHEVVRPGEVQADPDRVVQSLGNLVSNAVAYGDLSEPIRVRTDVDAEAATISVRNQGTPIAPDLMPHLFEPMVRGTGVSNSGRSVGLGLYIVRAIAAAHEGSVSVQSTKDEGTAFCLSLAVRLPSAAVHDD